MTSEEGVAINVCSIGLYFISSYSYSCSVFNWVFCLLVILYVQNKDIYPSITHTL